MTLEFVGASVYVLSHVAQDLKLQMFILTLLKISSNFSSQLSSDRTDFQECILIASKAISQGLEF